MADELEAMLMNDDDSDSDDGNSLNQHPGGGGGDPVVTVPPGTAYPPAAAAVAMTTTAVPTFVPPAIPPQPLPYSASSSRAPAGAAVSSTVLPLRPNSPLRRTTSSSAPASSSNTPSHSFTATSAASITSTSTGYSGTSGIPTGGSSAVPTSSSMVSGNMNSSSATRNMSAPATQIRTSSMSQQDQQAKLKSLYQQSASSSLHASSGFASRATPPNSSGPVPGAPPSRSSVVSMNVEPTPLRDMQSSSHSQSIRPMQSTHVGGTQKHQLQPQMQQLQHSNAGVASMRGHSSQHAGGNIGRGASSVGRIHTPSSASHAMPQHSMSSSVGPTLSSSLPPPASAAAAVVVSAPMSSSSQAMQTISSSVSNAYPSHGQQHPSYPRNPIPSSTSTSASSAAVSNGMLSAEQKTSKERKEQFLMFTKVLMKYLEQKDPGMHARAKEVIRDCARKNKEGDPSYASLSASMQSHLKTLVGDLYWKKAQDYLRQYLATQYLKSGKTPQEARRKAEIMARSAASPLTMDSGVMGVGSSAGGAVGVVGIASSATPVVMNTSGGVASESVSASLPHVGTQVTGAQGMAGRKPTISSQQQTAGGASVTSSVASSSKATTAQYVKHKHGQKLDQKPTVGKNASERMPVESASTAPVAASVSSQTTAAPISSSSSSSTKKKSAASSSGSVSGKASSSSAKVATSGGSVGKNATSSPISASSKKKKVAPTITKKVTTAPVPSSSVPKEYNDGMEMLDHVVDYDVSSCALILGKESKRRGDVNITEEQRKLLYSDFGITKVGPRKGLYGSMVPTERKSPTSVTEDSLQSILPSYLKGWGTRNIISSRIAWAKLRLIEEDEDNLSRVLLPTVERVEGNGQQGVNIQIRNKSSPSKSSLTEMSWFNEETAEEDETLALISEATQQYISTLLQSAMNCASRRLNLDGIRLWHQQHAAARLQDGHKIGDTQGKIQDPPLHLRLGCDTRRQYALVQGNAAKTYQRLEEALSRQDHNGMNAQTLYYATSMSEFSKIPTIPSAIANADYNAKRTFEIYGGKESGEPPLGRVPKRAKILAKDFRMCMEQPGFVLDKKKCRFLGFF